MKPRRLCAVVLALALPALGQTEPQLEPLVPNDAPWLQKNQKKRKKAPPKQAPAEQARKPAAEPPLTLPPLAPLTPSPMAANVGVPGAGHGARGAAASVEAGLRAVARRRRASRPPRRCRRRTRARKRRAGYRGSRPPGGSGLVAGYEHGALKVRIVDVKARKQIAEAQQAGIAADPTQVTAWAEALACKLLVAAGCTGEASVDAAPGIELGDRWPTGAPRREADLPVGVRALRVREGKTESSRALPVLLEGAPPVFVEATRVAPAAAPAPRRP